MNGDTFEPPDENDSDDEQGDSSEFDQSAQDPQGFVPPSGRDWIHPSELGGALRAVPNHRRRRSTILLGTAAGIILLGGFALLISVHRQPALVQSVTVSSATSVQGVPSNLKGVAVELVSIVVHKNSSSSRFSGVVIDHQDVVTNQKIPLMSSVEVTTSHGEQFSVAVIKYDPASDVTVLRLSQSVSDPTQPSIVMTKGSMTLVSTGCGSCEKKAVLDWAPAAVTSEHQTISHDDLLLDVLTVSSSMQSEPGSVLVNADGMPVAISAPELGTSSYLPMEFVASEAEHLMTASVTGHGYLQIDGSNAPSGGAEVTKIAQGSPATGLLHVGDVITEVNAQSLSTMAGLIDILYVTPSGSKVDLTVVRDGKPDLVSVTLASTP